MKRLENGFVIEEVDGRFTVTNQDGETYCRKFPNQKAAEKFAEQQYRKWEAIFPSAEKELREMERTYCRLKGELEDLSKIGESHDLMAAFSGSIHVNDMEQVVDRKREIREEMEKLESLIQSEKRKHGYIPAGK